MSNDPPDKPKRRHWLWANHSQLTVLVLIVVGLLLAQSLLKWIGWGVWVLALLALTAWLVAPDLFWAWREHPAAVRRALHYLTHPRTVRVLLYALLALAWWVTVL